jgi:hypothetical protein
LNRRGKRHGAGILYWKTNSRYEGHFEEDEINGLGKYVFPPESQFERIEGIFHKGEFDPRGSLTMKDGTSKKFGNGLKINLQY